MGRDGKRWEEMFNVLKEYKEEHGDCNVPSNWIENKHLANWVSTQRTNYTNKQLSNDRIKRLEEIGFVWRADRTLLKEQNEKRWEKMFDVLKEYKEEHGDCNVPSRWKVNNINISPWVFAQRYKYRDRKLSKEQIERLEEIGFEWNIHKR